MSPSPQRDRDTHVEAVAAVTASDDFQSSKKKRSNSDVVEYPRRRATIAVCFSPSALCPAFSIPPSITFPLHEYSLIMDNGKCDSVRYAACGKQNATGRAQSASSVLI